MKKKTIYFIFLLFFLTACRNKENVQQELVQNPYEGTWLLKEKYINGKIQDTQDGKLIIHAASFTMESSCRILGGLTVRDGGMVVDVKKSSCPIQEAYVGEKIPYTYKVSPDLKKMTIWTAKNKNELMYVYEK